jgi:hypothetical protein
MGAVGLRSHSPIRDPVVPKTTPRETVLSFHAAPARSFGLPPRALPEAWIACADLARAGPSALASIGERVGLFRFGSRAPSASGGRFPMRDCG